MKKFLALALALVMALALAVPAMAFTDKGVAEDYVPSLGIELVEFENDAFFGIVGAAPSDRGYAKNEIVAFIVTLEIAKDETNGDYNRLEITGENVSFNTTEEEAWTANAPKLYLNKTKTFYYANLETVKGKAKLQWLGFAKVTGDDASITAKLFTEGEDDAAKFTGDTFEVVDEDEVVYTVTATGTDFVVVWDDGGFAIEADKKGVSKALYVTLDGQDVYKVIENKNGEYVFLNADNGDVEPGSKDKAVKALYEALVAIVDDVFEGVFGFEYDLLGGVVNKKYFESLVSYDVVEATADIAPWVAYVQVPDVIVVDPPKTGDATVLVGIVMAIVAAAGVVVFNKVRA